MYYSALRKLIESVEEKRFYDVSIMYLGAQKYRDLCIVDGTGDGGRDVTCSRKDLRIQLSVRRDWEKKINEEAALTLSSGKTHLIYVTNRTISPGAEAAFRASKYHYAGRVEVSIHDLNRIATALIRPARLRQAYEMLGASVNPTIQVSVKDIAISSVLLFGDEANELREQVVNANIKAWLLHHPEASEEVLVDEVARSLPGANSIRSVRSAISRLRTSGQIEGKENSVNLAKAEFDKIKSAEEEFVYSLGEDIKQITSATGLSRDEADELLNLSIEILLKGNGFGAGGPNEESIRAFLADKGLFSIRGKIYDVLSKTGVARRFQYAKTVDQIFSTNTFDIYRALGGKTSIVMVLDTSVILPMLFGLEFKVASSRYAVAASALQEVCDAHQIQMMVPKAYVNEMASHGIKALRFVETYGALPDDMKSILTSSGNAYLSHYSHIRESMANSGSDISLNNFLATFGIKSDASPRRIENRITSILEQRGIQTGMNLYYEQAIRDEFATKKPHDGRHIIDHDAAVCTYLISDTEKGYILATWDKVVIDVVQELARVYADSPARVIDFLSMVDGVDHDYTHSNELLTTLLHVDERYQEKLARKLEMIQSPEQAYRLRSFIEEARSRKGSAWMPDVDDLSHFLDSKSSQEKYNGKRRPGLTPVFGRLTSPQSSGPRQMSVEHEAEVIWRKWSGPDVSLSADFP